MATASSSDPVMKSEGSGSGGETSEAASTIGMAALVGKGNNYQQQLMVKYRGIKKSKKDRGCTAKERISKMTPCAAGKRSSIYRGVTRHRWTGRYEAHLWDKSTWNENQNKKGKQVYLGAYDDEEAAARAYDLAALKYWGPGTLINFPVTDYTRDLEEMQNLSREDYLASLRRKGSGFSRGTSKCRGISSTRWDSPLGRVTGADYHNCTHHGDDATTENEYAGGFLMDRKIDLTPYIKWWGPTKSRQSEKTSDETNHGSSEDIGSDLKPPEWPTEPYQLPHLGLSHESKQPKKSSVSAMSILSRSAAYKSLQEKALKKEEKEVENDENENKNNINKIDYGKAVEKLGREGASEGYGGVAVGMESGGLQPIQRSSYALTPFLTAPLLTNYNAIDPLGDTVLWSSLVPPSSQPMEATKVETSSDYSFYQHD